MLRYKTRNNKLFDVEYLLLRQCLHVVKYTPVCVFVCVCVYVCLCARLCTLSGTGKSCWFLFTNYYISVFIKSIKIKKSRDTLSGKAWRVSETVSDKNCNM